VIVKIELGPSVLEIGFLCLLFNYTFVAREKTFVHVFGIG